MSPYGQSVLEWLQHPNKHRKFTLPWGYGLQKIIQVWLFTKLIQCTYVWSMDNFKYCNLLQSILHCSGNCRQRTNFVWRLGYRQQLPRLGSLQRHWRVTGWWCFIETRLRCNRKRHKITMCITTMICVQPFYLWIQLSVYDIISERNIDSIYKNLQIPSYVLNTCKNDINPR